MATNTEAVGAKPRQTKGGMSMNRMFGLAFGAVYLVVGAVGFIVTRGVEFAATEGNNLLFFEVNPLHNIVHLAIGALLVGGAIAGTKISRMVNTAVGITYIAVGALGLFIADTSLNIFAFNAADHALHFATGILAIAVASAGRETATAY